MHNNKVEQGIDTIPACDVEKLLNSLYSCLSNPDSDVQSLHNIENFEMCKLTAQSLFNETITRGEYCTSMIKKFHQMASDLKSRCPTISFLDFKVGDIALFMPTDVTNRKNWMAFSAGGPHRFLAEVTISNIYFKRF